MLFIFVFLCWSSIFHQNYYKYWESNVVWDETTPTDRLVVKARPVFRVIMYTTYCWLLYKCDHDTFNGIYLYIRNIYTYIRSVFRVLMYTTYCWLLHDECCLKWGNLIFHPSPKVSFQSLWRTSNDIIQTFSLLVTIPSF